MNMVCAPCEGRVASKGFNVMVHQDLLTKVRINDARRTDEREKGAHNGQTTNLPMAVKGGKKEVSAVTMATVVHLVKGAEVVHPVQGRGTSVLVNATEKQVHLHHALAKPRSKLSRISKRQQKGEGGREEEVRRMETTGGC